MAVAFTAYDSNPEPILDPTYGELVFNHFMWGPQPDGSYTTERRRIKKHTCSREELGLDGDPDKAVFLPIYEDSRDEVDFYSKKFECVDKEDLILYGDYSSYKASQFNVQFIKCHDRPDCKSQEEITAFIRNKFLLILYNQVRFDSTRYEWDSIIHESKIMWLPVNSQVQQTTPFKVLTT